jgi:hypothetical protein
MSKSKGTSGNSSSDMKQSVVLGIWIDAVATASTPSDQTLPTFNTATRSMTTKDLTAVNDSLRAYRALLPLMHEPSNVKQVTDAIKQLEALKASA